MAGSRIKAQPDRRVLVSRIAAVMTAAGVGPRHRLCVALSGGADSVVTLHLLAALRPQLGFDLAAAHVHHGISAHADDWRIFCDVLCGRLSVPLQVFEVSVRRDHPDGLEAAARNARHAALMEVAADWLVFGHHQDDQAETVLYRLLRGAGVRGAGAMAPIEPGSPGRLRPLLDTRRSEVVDYARACSLEWIEDESNADRRHMRNLLRHEVMPRIEGAFPAAVSMLARSAVNFREADELLGELASMDAEHCGNERFDLAALKDLSDARMRNLMRFRIRALGMEAPPRARLIEALRQLRGGEPLSLHLPLGDAAICAHRGKVWIEPVQRGEPVEAVWRGESRLAWGQGDVIFERRAGEGLSAARLEAAGEVRLTTRSEGLRMCVSAGRPRHSFKNLCQEAGIPAWMRKSLPVLRVDGAPAWIAGVGMAPDYCCAPGEAGVVPRWREWTSAELSKDSDP